MPAPVQGEASGCEQWAVSGRELYASRPLDAGWDRAEGRERKKVGRREHGFGRVMLTVPQTQQQSG